MSSSPYNNPAAWGGLAESISTVESACELLRCTPYALAGLLGCPWRHTPYKWTQGSARISALYAGRLARLLIAMIRKQADIRVIDHITWHQDGTFTPVLKQGLGSERGSTVYSATAPSTNGNGNKETAPALDRFWSQRP